MPTDGIDVNVSGTWRKATPHVKVSGTWRKCQKVWANVGGTWQLVWQDRAPQTVSTFDATDSGSFQYGSFDRWRTDNDDVYQGEYGFGDHRGCYFYGSNPFSILNTDGGRVIDKVEIYLVRKNGGGSSAAQGVDGYLHGYTSQPASSTAPVLSQGPESFGSFAWGEAKWVTLPNDWGEKLRDGTHKGVGIWAGSDQSPYVILDGRSVNSNRGRLRITHS